MGLTRVGHIGNVYITCGALWYNRSNVVRFPLFDIALQFLTECQFTHTRTHTQNIHTRILNLNILFFLIQTSRRCQTQYK